MNLEKNYIKKFLLKSKQEAIFSHYCHGNLYYQVTIDDKIYQFPISTVEDKYYFESTSREIKSLDLSSDLGTTDFTKEIRASHLNRWIDMAIDNGEFIQVG